MAGPNHVLVKTFVAGAAIAKNTIVMFDSADDTVIVATANTDLPIGIAPASAPCWPSDFSPRFDGIMGDACHLT